MADLELIRERLSLFWTQNCCVYRGGCPAKHSSCVLIGSQRVVIIRSLPCDVIARGPSRFVQNLHVGILWQTVVVLRSFCSSNSTLALERAKDTYTRLIFYSGIDRARAKGSNFTFLIYDDLKPSHGYRKRSSRLFWVGKIVSWLLCRHFSFLQAAFGLFIFAA